MPLPTEQVIIKKRWSAFFQTHLDLVLKRQGVKNVVVAGVQVPGIAMHLLLLLATGACITVTHGFAG